MAERAERNAQQTRVPAPSVDKDASDRNDNTEEQRMSEDPVIAEDIPEQKLPHRLIDDVRQYRTKQNQSIVDRAGETANAGGRTD